MSENLAALIVGVWLVGALGTLMLTRAEYRVELSNARRGLRGEPSVWPYLIAPAFWPIAWALLPVFVFIIGAIELTGDL